MSESEGFWFPDPSLDEGYLSELLKIVAPDRATFFALCASDIAAGYGREVSEAARRLFPFSGASRVYAKPGAGSVSVLEYDDGSDVELF